MPKPKSSDLDVLVLGEHPATYLAAALLRQKSDLRVLHCAIPGDAPPERLVIINPHLFDLHPILGGMRRKLQLTAVYGLQFLSDDPAVRSEARFKTATALVGSYKQIRQIMTKLAEAAGVEMAKPPVLQIHRLDETGLDVTVGKKLLRPKALVLGGNLAEGQQKMLGLPESWEREVVHRYSFVRLSRGARVELGGRPMVQMSLDLKGTLCWAWLLKNGPVIQAAVAQRVHSPQGLVSSVELLGHWLTVLRNHHILKGGGDIMAESVESMELPLAGAMAHEGVANRTLLIGPAGGFYSACAEDIYPNCWSAIYAADALRKALSEPHLQDALHPYRHKWRTTLGDYLRGPQQDLRFLLPLVYRNQVMTTRLTESILLGKSVVR